MRFAMIGAAAAALLAVVPASAASYIINPATPTITFAQTQVCTTMPMGCTNSTPGPYTPREIVVDFTGRDGTYNFSGTIGSSSNSGTMDYNATIVFQMGSLISDLVTFTYMQATSNQQMGSLTTIRGFYQNTTLYDINTKEILTPVPEAATWAMMLVGFGALGLALRRRQYQTSALRSVILP